MNERTKQKIKELIDAVDDYVSCGPPVTYNGDDDSVGQYSCCYKLSYVAHAKDCPWKKMKDLVLEIRSSEE